MKRVAAATRATAAVAGRLIQRISASVGKQWLAVNNEDSNFVEVVAKK